MREEKSLNLVIYGAGYPDVIKLIDAINKFSKKWNVIGFIDDTPEKQDKSFMGYPILGNKKYIDKLDKENIFFYNNVSATTTARMKVSEIMIKKECKFATLIHPTVDIRYAKIGYDVMITEGVLIGSNVRIGNHCCIRHNSVITHDNYIDDYVFVGPGATLCGHVKIKRSAYIGAGSTIKERVEIGENSIIGAGATVIKNVRSNVTAVGVPAKEI